MTTRLRARSISRSLRPFLKRSHTGSVPATFARSCYVDLDGRILALVAAELLDGPLNVVVEVSGGFRFEQILTGTSVLASSKGLTFANGVRVSLAGARTWDARLRPLDGRDASALRQGLGAIRTVLADAPVESLARHEQRPWRASDAMSVLAAGLRRRDVSLVADAAARLSGFGPGLTPSGDDLLAGTLIALTVLQPLQAGALRDAILLAARGRTTRISDAYLDAAARGEAGEAWHRMVPALAHAESDRVVGAARRVMAFGETSGADMLAGFVLAADALLESTRPTQPTQSTQSPETI